MLRFLAAAATIALSLGACGGGDPAPATPPAVVVAAITSQPSDRSVVQGTAATFTVGAAGASGYQWQRSSDGGGSYTDVTGATAASHTTPAAAPADNGNRYRVIVTGAANSVISSAALLTVTAAPVPATITVQPLNQTVSAGLDASFSVTAGGTSITYQWQGSVDAGASFSDVAGATGPTLNLAAVGLAANGAQFRVAVANSLGSVTSNAATLTVNAVQSVPLITTQPASAAVVAPAVATFTAAATGTPAPTLQWQSSTNGGISFTDIAAATSASYTTPGTAGPQDGQQFRMVATNAAGSATSNAATLTVGVQVPPSFTTQPANVTITAGQSAQLTVAAGGVPTPTVQWELSTDGGANWNSIVGATGDVFNLQGVALANNGRQFRAVATNAVSAVNSNAALLTVNAAPVAPNLILTRSDGTQANRMDLFAIREDGSGELQLTSSPGSHFVRAITATGRVIYQTTIDVLTGEVDLFSVNSDGTGRVTLANSTDPESFVALTPGGRVIYRRDTVATGRDIWSVGVDGSNPQLLAGSAANDDFRGLTSSGKVIYSVTPIGGGQTDLFSVNADGTGNAPLAADPNYYEGYYGETATGQIIISTSDANFGLSGTVSSLNGVGGLATVLATNTNFLEYDVAGFTRTGQVILNRLVNGQRDLYAGSVALAASADHEVYVGSTATGQVIYTRSGPGSGFGGFQSDMYIVNADGSNTVALANSTTSNEDFVAVAPDGRIIYSSCTIPDGQCGLYSVNADGTGRLTVADSPLFLESFQAVTASGRVIYSSENGTAPSLFAANTDGTGTTLLRVRGYFVAVTPGGKVLVRSQDNGNASLYIVNADGTGLVPLATTPVDEFFGGVFGP